MKKIVLITSVVMLSLNLSASYADWGDNCPSGTTAGTDCKKCGPDCAFTKTDSGAVTIYGSGEAMCTSGYRWKTIDGVEGFYSGDTADTKHPFYGNTGITSVSFSPDSNFTSIGINSFGARSLTNITIPDSVTNIGINAFLGATSLTSITIPDSVISIGNNAFYSARSLNEIIIPDSWGDEGFNLDNLNDEMFGNSCFAGFKRPSNCPTDADGYPSSKIVCRGDVEKCKTALAKFGGNGNCTVDRNYCIDNNRIVEAVNPAQCNSKNYYYTGSECIREPDVSKRICDYEVKGWVKVGNTCVSPENSYAKKHYTPAEANQWLYDDNNTIIMTFKVNR